MEKKLYRSNSNKVIAGVCGGLGEYFNIDVTIVRLIWVFFVLAGGCGVIAYLVCALVFPLNPGQPQDTNNTTNSNNSDNNGNNY